MLALIALIAAVGLGAALAHQKLICRQLRARLDQADQPRALAEPDELSAPAPEVPVAGLDLDRAVELSGSFEAAARTLAASSQMLGARSEWTTHQADVVLSDSEHARRAVTEMISVFDGLAQVVDLVRHERAELSEAVTSVADDAENVALLAETAGQAGHEARERITGVSQAVDGVGQLVSSIRSIADQTNMLALNAAIEAASAGEAGRGFAVVAAEVKELAHQVALITDDIATRITELGSAAGEAVDSVEQVSGRIESISNRQTAIAAAAEQQAAMAASLDQHMSEMADGIERLREAGERIAEASDRIGGSASAVEQAAREAGATAADVESVAGRVAQATASLSELVEAAAPTSDLGIGDSADFDAQIEKALAAHGLWKQRLLQAAGTGSSEFDPANVRPDNRCEFGRWLHESIDDEAAGLDGYGVARELHARFHRQAADILELALGGQTERAREQIAPDSEYAQLSRQLTAALLDWQSERSAAGRGMASLSG